MTRPKLTRATFNPMGQRFSPDQLEGTDLTEEQLAEARCRVDPRLGPVEPPQRAKEAWRKFRIGDRLDDDELDLIIREGELLAVLLYNYSETGGVLRALHQDLSTLTSIKRARK